jgi:DNA-binding CsgD family transcriptional regulator
MLNMKMTARKGSSQLSRAEQRVLVRVLRGEANKEIAHELGCALRTVELHVSSILRKTGAESRLRLLALALERAGVSPTSAVSFTCGSPQLYSANEIGTFSRETDEGLERY